MAGTDRPLPESEIIRIRFNAAIIGLVLNRFINRAASCTVALRGAEMSLEAKMARRFPQKVKVGDLIGLPVEDDDDIALGHVQQVVRSPEDKIKLIVTYSRWFGWFGRPVAVPMEAVAILGKEIASLEMPPAEYKKAPTWVAGTDRPLPESEIIRIALTRR